MSDSRNRACDFASAYGLQVPILMAPMAGACPTSLAIAVGNAGGMGACGTVLMSPEKIGAWVFEFRAGTGAALQLNTWISDPEPQRNAEQELQLRAFLQGWGPAIALDATEKPQPDLQTQCRAMLDARPEAISSIMGVFDASFVTQLKASGIKWFATVTTVGEALIAEKAGADVVVAQGMEAGGHRGAFDAAKAGSELVGLFSLLPAVVDAVNVPVIATGGIADGRGVAAALVLGASAVQIGTALLRSPEAKLAPAWADAIGASQPENTQATRSFSGRLGRAVRTRYVEAAMAADAPDPAPYPIQRHLTQAMRNEGMVANDIDRIQAWAGQSAQLARPVPAAEIVRDMWQEAKNLLPG